MLYGSLVARLCFRSSVFAERRYQHGLHLFVESSDDRHFASPHGKCAALLFCTARICGYINSSRMLSLRKFMTMTRPLANPLRALLLSRNFYLPRIVALLLCCGLCTASAQQSQQGNPPQQQRPRRVGNTKPRTPAQAPQESQTQVGQELDEGDVVRVETQLVSVPAVVTDHTGRPVANLRAENFLLYEDGRPQQISNFATTEAPFEVALLLDTSGSTRADVALIRRAAIAFIESLRPGDRVSIVAFNTENDGAAKLATVDVLTKLTSDRAVLRRALDNIGTSNGTPFYDALEQIAETVFREPPRDEVRGRRAVVALTDGVDSASVAEFADARSGLMRADVACYFVQVNTEDFVEDRLLQDCQNYGTIHLSKTQLKRYQRIFVPRGDASDYADFCSLGPFERMQISRQLYNLARAEMHDLARSSGGKTFSAASLQDARAAFSEVSNEIGTQYSLGYYSTNKARDGRFRSIRVEVRGVKDGQVRAREGYQAPKS
jgi:Ca-activated chloride channel family protein